MKGELKNKEMEMINEKIIDEIRENMKEFLMMKENELLEKQKLGKNVFKFYRPIASIRFPNFFNEKQKDEAHSIFEKLEQENCEIISEYIHLFTCQFDNLRLKNLFEILFFAIEIDCFDRLKALVGLRIEEQIKKSDIFELGEILKIAYERNFISVVDWLIFHFTNLNASEEDLDKIDLPTKLERRALSNKSKVDNHIEDIFGEISKDVKFVLLIKFNSIFIKKKKE